MSDVFSAQSKGLTSPGDRHYTVAASSTPLDPKPRGLYVSVSGNVVMEDDQGTSITYPVAAGTVLPFRPYKVTALGGATLVAWY
jgi:hypothetical protein